MGVPKALSVQSTEAEQREPKIGALSNATIIEVKKVQSTESIKEPAQTEGPIRTTENENENLSKDIEAGNTQPQAQETSKPKRNCFQRVFHMGPGSFKGAVFNLCILSLGVGSLSLPQKVENLSLVFLPVAVVLAGLANLLSLNVLAILSDKYKIRVYSGLVNHLYGRPLSIFFDAILILNAAGVIMVYQITIYKLVGGLVNDIGKYGYKGINDFKNNSFWKESSYKFIVNYSITVVILIPLCLLKHISKMRFSSAFGIICLFIITMVIVIESPWFASHYFKEVYKKEDKSTHLNVYDITAGFTKEVEFFKSMATLFYAYSCQLGVFPIIDSLKESPVAKVKKVFRVGIIIDIICYVIIGITGYLTQPIDTPDLIFERDSIFKNDIVMTIGRAAFILALLTKIPANFNALRVSILGFCGYDQNDYPNWLNAIITVVALAITTLVGVVYQNIADYISLIGSFCTVIVAFLIPGLLYFRGSGLGNSCKNITIFVIFIVLSLIGFVSGILTIISLATK